MASSQPPSAAPAAAALSTTDTTGNVPPQDAAPVAAPVASVAPAPAPAAVVASHEEEVVPQKKLGVGSWVLFALGFLAVAGIAVKFLRRRLRSPTSIVDFTSIHPEPKPALVTRP